MQGYLRDGSAQTILCAATLRYKFQIKLSVSPSHSILTPGQSFPALTLCQVPGKVATGVPFLKSLIWLKLKQSQRKRDSNPGSSPLKTDALTTRPNEVVNCGWPCCGVVFKMAPNCFLVGYCQCVLASSLVPDGKMLPLIIFCWFMSEIFLAWYVKTP